MESNASFVMITFSIIDLNFINLITPFPAFPQGGRSKTSRLSGIRKGVRKNVETL